MAMDTAHRLIVAPTPESLHRISPVHWVDRTDPVTAYLLLAHPPGLSGDDSNPAVIEARMRGLAAALHLTQPKPGPIVPNLHRRFGIHEGAVIVELDCSFDMSVPISDEWAQYVHAGVQVVIAVGLDPLPWTAPRATVAAYLASHWYSGRILMGATGPAQKSVPP